MFTNRDLQGYDYCDCIYCYVFMLQVLLLKQQQKCTQDCKQVFSAEQLYHLVLKFTHPET